MFGSKQDTPPLIDNLECLGGFATTHKEHEFRYVALAATRVELELPHPLQANAVPIGKVGFTAGGNFRDGQQSRQAGGDDRDPQDARQRAAQSTDLQQFIHGNLVTATFRSSLKSPW